MLGIRFTTKGVQKLQGTEKQKPIKSLGYPAKKRKRRCAFCRRFVRPDDGFEFRRCNNITRWPEWICGARILRRSCIAFVHILWKQNRLYTIVPRTTIALYIIIIVEYCYYYNTYSTLGGTSGVGRSYNCNNCKHNNVTPNVERVSTRNYNLPDRSLILIKSYSALYRLFREHFMTDTRHVVWNNAV